MSELTDRIDNAGAGAPSDDLTPRIGWALARHGADFALTRVGEHGPTWRDISAAVPDSLTTLVRSASPDDIPAAADDREIEWSYRGHPIVVRDTARGRALLHALYLLEADMMSAKGSAERLHLIIEACREALRAEARRDTIEARLTGPTPEALDATGAAAAAVEVDLAKPTGGAAAAIVSNGTLGVVGAPADVMVMLSRLGRPSLGFVTSGRGAMLRAVRLIVQRVDAAVSLDAACRAAPVALGDGLAVYASPRVAQSVREYLTHRGHLVTLDESLATDATCVAVSLEDDGAVKGAGHAGAQVAQRVASNTSDHT